MENSNDVQKTTNVGNEVLADVSTSIIYNDSDEWFVGNLVALATSELALVRKGKNEKVDRKMLISWIVEHL